MIQVPEKKDGEKYDFEELYDIIRKLRSPEGCPWDREQTHFSLIKPMIEEAYETVDAIEKNDAAKMTEELGDVLLQVIFHSLIGEEDGAFGFSDITDRCARKMLSRHTHIFGKEHAENATEALANWDAAKLKEKGFSGLREDLDDIPRSFPALMRAGKTAKKIRKAGGVSAYGEKTEALLNREAAEAMLCDEETVGALLYEVCRIAEKNGVEAELALRRFTDRVIEEN